MTETNTTEVTVRQNNKISLPNDVQEGDLVEITYRLIRRPENYQRRTVRTTKNSKE